MSAITKQARPVCVHCGKAYGTRNTETVTIRWRPSEEKPRHVGNAIVISESESQHQSSRSVIGGVDMTGLTYCYRKLWDGTWVRPYRPFCTLRCALDYARRAHSLAHELIKRRD